MFIDLTAWKKLASGDKIRGRGGTPLVAAPDGKSIFILGGFAGKFKYMPCRNLRHIALLDCSANFAMDYVNKAKGQRKFITDSNQSTCLLRF